MCKGARIIYKCGHRRSPVYSRCWDSKHVNGRPCLVRTFPMEDDTGICPKCKYDRRERKAWREKREKERNDRVLGLQGTLNEQLRMITSSAQTGTSSTQANTDPAQSEATSAQDETSSQGEALSQDETSSQGGTSSQDEASTQDETSSRDEEALSQDEEATTQDEEASIQNKKSSAQLLTSQDQDQVKSSPIDTEASSSQIDIASTLNHETPVHDEETSAQTLTQTIPAQIQSSSQTVKTTSTRGRMKSSNTPTPTNPSLIKTEPNLSKMTSSNPLKLTSPSPTIRETLSPIYESMKELQDKLQAHSEFWRENLKKLVNRLASNPTAERVEELKRGLKMSYESEDSFMNVKFREAEKRMMVGCEEGVEGLLDEEYLRP